MEELVKLVSQRTGLSDDMARKAIDTVVDYISNKVPPIAGLIHNALGVASGAAKQTGEDKPQDTASNLLSRI